jgi:hypothetical protein
MRITVTRTGGFAGLHQQLGPVETSDLESDVADRVSGILTGSDFFNLPEQLPTTGQVQDDFEYTVRVTDDDRDHTVQFEGQSGSSASTALLELIRLLEDAAGGFHGVPISGDALDGVVDTRDWAAWYNRMPGSADPCLHVSGICGLASSHTKVRLEPGNVGSVPEPDLYALQLVVTRPDIDDDRYVECEVSWQDDVGQEIKRVRINGIGIEIPVKIAQ